MNIFALSKNVRLAAKWHVDKHIVKMPLETAQILCTVNYIYGNKRVPYKPLKNMGRECIVWAGKTTGNYKWLVRLGISLCKEYTFRYGKTHKCEEIIRKISKPPTKLKVGRRTKFIQAMPDDCKCKDSIRAYHNYYILYKQHLATWKKRKKPYWMKIRRRNEKSNK